MAGTHGRRGETTTTTTVTGVRVTKTRAMMVGGHRRAAPSTPVPSWKVFNNQLYDGVGKPPPASARKLAASLWELQDLPLPACFSACLQQQHRNGPARPNRDPPSPADESASSPHSQPDYVLSPPKTSRKTASSRHEHETHLRKLLNKTNMEPAAMVDRQRHIPCALFTMKPGETTGPQSTTMSQELLRVFSQIRLLEEQHHCSLNLTTALHSELLQAHARVRELEQQNHPQQRNNNNNNNNVVVQARREVESLMKKFSEEKLAWKLKAKENLNAVQSQLDDERAARHRLENANRQLTKELIEAQSAAAKAVQELERERKARQLIEEVCHELAQETGEDKAEVEEMKRQSQKVRDELEEERRMLQLAEVWREERVQMKLGEAKLALEEKTAALDVMKGELESFLRAPGSSHSLRDAQVLHNVINAISSRDAEPAPLYYAEGIPDAD